MINETFDWKRKVSDVKKTGLGPDPCDKCGVVFDRRVRISFDATGDEHGCDKYVCDTCANGVLSGRSFNIFNQQI